MTPVVEKLGSAVDDWVAKNHGQLVSTRRHLHAHGRLRVMINRNAEKNPASDFSLERLALAEPLPAEPVAKAGASAGCVSSNFQV